MTAQPGTLTRQQLYDRIRESSRDEVMLEDMIRLGFWPDGTQQPNLPGELIRRRGDLQREIAELHKKSALWRDPETALKEMHKRRKREALERRKETKLRNAKKRHDRALAWHARRGDEAHYLGAGVSGGLRADGATPGTLAAGLPAIATVKALAEAIGISMGELRFLAYDRAVAKISHYQRFTIPKKTGGTRLISAPMPRLKRAQYWVLDNLLAKVPVHPAAHGFVPDRSIVTNARAHVGRDVVVNLDLKDFFPTLTFRRIKGKFRGLGYAEPVATVLALICTEPDVDELELDGEKLFASRGPRRLPQGAPTSPNLTNLVCKRLDARLDGLAGSLGFTYTRYADDMTFSASGEAAGKVGALLKHVGEIVTAEGFSVHPDKTRVMRRGGHQEVTGLTANERVSVPRDTLRRFRALLHQIGKTGPSGKAWGKSGEVLDAALGFAFFVRMVSPEIGEGLIREVRDLRLRHGKTAQPMPVPTTFRAKAAGGEVPSSRWWTAKAPEAPAPEPILLPPKPDAQAKSSTTAPPTPRIPQGGGNAIRAQMRQELPRSGVWGPGPAQPPTSQGGSRFTHLVSVLFKVLGALLLISILMGVAPHLAPLIVAAVVGYLVVRRWKR